MLEITDAVTCTRCPLHQGRTQTVLPDGPGYGIMAVGEAPGRDEDTSGQGFVGAAGRTLDGVLAEHGIGREDYARTNMVWCRPPDNRNPKADELRTCRPFFDSAIPIFRPRVFLAVGRVPAAHLLGGVFGPPGVRYTFLQGVERLAGILETRGISALPSYSGIPVVAIPHTSGLGWNRHHQSLEGERVQNKTLGRRVIRALVEARDHE